MTKSAYTYDEAGAEVGISKRSIELEVAENRLVPVFYRSKPLIRHEELQRWLDALPTDKPSVSAA